MLRGQFFGRWQNLTSPLSSLPTDQRLPSSGFYSSLHKITNLNTRFKQKRMPNKGNMHNCTINGPTLCWEGNFELPDRKGQNCSLHLQNADLFLFWLFLWLWRICEKKLTLHMERWISPERGGRILSQEALSVSICVYSALLAGGQKYSKYTKTFHLLFVLNAIGSWAPNPVSVLLDLQHLRFSPCVASVDIRSLLI